MSLLRSIRNVAVGYTSTQVKVRNATSNNKSSADPQELSEIAELTYNNQELFFIMDMIDKRLNDKGKNWRHVMKSLILLDYLVHHGSENVIIWCHAKFYVIKTLREFEYRDESGKEYGNAIRARAKELVSLLNNNERLREVRRNASSGRGGGGSRSGRRFQERFGDRNDGYEHGSRSDSSLPNDRPSRYRSARGGDRHGDQGGDRSSRRRTPEEEDPDIRRAIELSKQSVEDDEKRRAQLRNASSEDISKAMNISQATGVLQQHQTGLYTQEDWNNYQRAQQEYIQYQEQLSQQQQLEQQLAQQQQALAQQQQEMAGFGQQYQTGQYTGQTQQQYSQVTGQVTGNVAGQVTGHATGQYGQQQSHYDQYAQNTGYGQGFQSQSTGFQEPQPLQPVKTGSNNPFATQNVSAQPQAYQQSQSQPSVQQYQQYQQPQAHAQQNNPFQQQYTGIATTQIQPSHTGYGFGNAQNQNRANGDSLIDL